jgi:hypothetical protein
VHSEVPDFSKIADRREAVRQFQEFRQSLALSYVPPKSNA